MSAVRNSETPDQPPGTEMFSPPLAFAHPTLLRVRSNQSTFREVEFKPGFNVVVAERTKEATKKESRNGLGKSSLIEIISFCLGGRFKKKDPLGNEALADWEFTLDMMLGGRPVSVSRATSSPKRVTILGETTNWSIQPDWDQKSQTRTLKVAEWNSVLGNLMFGLPTDGFQSKFAPSFRSLISYFVRKGKDAYSVPFEHYRKQLEWDKQVNNAFLLGISWLDASQWQQLKVEHKLLDVLKAADKSPVMAEVMQGSLGELEAIKVRLESLVSSAEASMNSFEVLPQYRELEGEANVLTGRITQAVNRIVANQQLLASYEANLAEVPESNVDDVIAVWEDAGVHFPNQTRRRLEDVKDFHRKLLDNRKRFLASEIERLRLHITDDEAIQRKAIDDRAAVMLALRGKGALDQLRRLQDVLSENQAQLKSVKSRIELLRQLAEGKSKLKIQEEQLKIRTQNDLDDRKDQREAAIRLFNGNSQALYESPGNLVIQVGKSGFQFDVEIVRSGSQGVGNMKILCYDLLLAEIWAAKMSSPRFLIHDSAMFDGVDERQIALGLELAERKSRECGFQYICTLNSDTIPWSDFSDGFDLNQFVRLTLTDRNAEGSLFGIRF